MPEATVEVLTAAVRVLMVGNRQVTLSVYRQLDQVDPGEIEPFGRVRDKQDADTGGSVYVVGVHRETGVLVRSMSDRSSRTLTVRNWEFLNRHVEKYYRLEDAGELALDRSGPRYAHEPRWVLHRDESDGAAARVIEFKYDTHNYGADPYFKWKSPEARQAAQPVFAAWLAEAAAKDERTAQWAALPLIVLAGLR